MQNDWQKMLQRAEEAFAGNDFHQALQLCDQIALLGEKPRYEAALLRGDILRALGDYAQALSCYESIADPSTLDARTDLARGLALFHLTRFAEAEGALQSALRSDPNLAEAYFTLGIMAEILDNGQDTEYFRQARKLDPETYPPNIHWSYEEFQTFVQEALSELPPHVREGLRGAQTIIMDLPHVEDLQALHPPISPTTFGMLVGIVPVDEVSNEPLAKRQRPAILLFKRNLERVCHSKEELLKQLHQTLMVDVITGDNE